MPDLQLPYGAQRYEASGTGSGGTTLTAGAANVKGAYVELIASTAFPAAGFWVFGRDQASAAGSFDFLVDITIDSAQVQIAVPNLLFSQSTDRDMQRHYIPLCVPVGSRISARCQMNGAPTTPIMGCAVVLHSQSFMSSPLLHRCTAYGINTADSGAVSVDPGGTANTKGAWSEIVAAASMTIPIRSLMIAFGNQANGATSLADWRFDIGIGPATEQIVVPDLWVMTSIQEFAPDSFNIPITIPAGTRLAVRSKSTTIDAADRLLDVALYGFD